MRAEMDEHEQANISIRGAKIDETAILVSGRTDFYRDHGTRFEAEVPNFVYPNAPREERGIIIEDSAINSLVIGSSDTTIDNRGGKTSIKIADDEPRDPARSENGSNVVINTVVDSADTSINIEGARFNIRGKKRRNHGRLQTGGAQATLTNTGAVNVIAYSQGSHINARNTEINIDK